MISCKETAKILASGTDPGFWGKLQLRMHLAICGQCQAYERQLAELKDAIRKLVEKEGTDTSSLEKEIIFKILEGKKAGT